MAENSQSELDEKNKKRFKSFIKRVAGIFWSFLWSVVTDALHILPAILISAAIIAFIYCMRTGTSFDDLIAFPEILDNAISDGIIALEKIYPDIGLYIAPFVTIAELVRAGIETLENANDERGNGEGTGNSHTNQSDRDNSTSPISQSVENPCGTYINAFFYTDNYQATVQTVMKNGREIVNAIKVSCTITNEHNRTETIIFESCVYMPAVNMVHRLPNVSYKVKPGGTVEADNPCPVDISPTMFDFIQQRRINEQGYKGHEERWVIRIMTNRKLMYEEEFKWEI